MLAHVLIGGYYKPVLSQDISMDAAVLRGGFHESFMMLFLERFRLTIKVRANLVVVVVVSF
jgi:hypothetical protein